MDGRNIDFKKFLPFVSAGVFAVVAAIIVAVSGVPQPESDEKPVLFSLDAPDARSVSVVGDWNHWDPAANRLALSNGLWQTTVKLKKGAAYFYNFLIDGERWITDPSRLAVSEDSFGKKSVLELYNGGGP
jgi:1,4-alpha-glucan branching enzyme